MIPRYSRPEMTAIWSPETRFRIWFEIEAHAADAMADLGLIPKEAAKTIRDKGRAATFDVARIDAIEAEVSKARFPLDFSDRVYTLRQHVDYVRRRLES